MIKLTEDLRNQLVKYIQRKFTNIPDIYNLADDIVNEAWLKVTCRNNVSNGTDMSQLMNFGYLSMICIRLAYRLYREKHNQSLDTIDLLISEQDVVEQIISHEQASLVLQSLDTLREIEKRIVMLRYYSDCSFAEISRKTGININTVLTMHRRALEKLRPRLSKILDYHEEYYNPFDRH